MESKEHLQQLYEKYEPDLAAYAWSSEKDRWAELVFCLLSQCSQKNVEFTRSAVDVLQSLSLTDLDKMIHLCESTDESRGIYAYVLRQYGFSSEEIEIAYQLLAHVANAIQDYYSGKLQRYLRQHGELMRDELVKMFGSTFFDKSRLEYAISLWLQNTLSLPISLQNKSVAEFCKKQGINLQELWQAADEHDINIAVIDDLLEMDLKTHESTFVDKKLEEVMK